MKKCIRKKSFNPLKFFKSIGIVVLLAVTFTLVVKSSASGTMQTEFKQVVVKKGDTIWQIAKENKGSNSDMEEAIYKIRKINNLKNPHLHPGQMLNVPINF